MQGAYRRHPGAHSTESPPFWSIASLCVLVLVVVVVVCFVCSTPPCPSQLTPAQREKMCRDAVDVLVIIRGYQTYKPREAETVSAETARPLSHTHAHAHTEANHALGEVLGV